MLLTKQNMKRIKNNDSRNMVTNNRHLRKVINIKSGKGSIAIASLMGTILVFSIVSTISEFEQQQAFAYGLLTEGASSTPSPSSASDAAEGSSMKETTGATMPVSTTSTNSMEQGTSAQPSSSVRSSASAIPQPNDNSTVVNVDATNACTNQQLDLQMYLGQKDYFLFRTLAVQTL